MKASLERSLFGVVDDVAKLFVVVHDPDVQRVVLVQIECRDHFKARIARRAAVTAVLCISREIDVFRVSIEFVERLTLFILQV